MKARERTKREKRRRESKAPPMQRRGGE